MTRKNFDKALRAYLGRSPFRAFTLELESGSRVEVNHPEALEQHENLVVCTSTASERLLAMTTEEFDRALRPRLDRKPFQPFVIESAYGDRWVVEQRKALMYYAGAAVYFRPDGNFDLVDSEAVQQVLDLPTAN